MSSREFDEVIKLSSNCGRLLVDIKIIDKNDDTNYEKCDCIIDTGCPNTVIDKTLAETFGKRIDRLRTDAAKVTKVIKLGGGVITPVPYLMPELRIQNLVLKNVAVLAATIELGDSTSVILGLNVINAWNLYLVSAARELHINEVPYNYGETPRNMYNRFVDEKSGRYLILDAEEYESPRKRIVESAVFGR